MLKTKEEELRSKQEEFVRLVARLDDFTSFWNLR